MKPSSPFSCGGGDNQRNVSARMQAGFQGFDGKVIGSKKNNFHLKKNFLSSGFILVDDITTIYSLCRVQFGGLVLRKKLLALFAGKMVD